MDQSGGRQEREKFSTEITSERDAGGRGRRREEEGGERRRAGRGKRRGEG